MRMVYTPIAVALAVMLTSSSAFAGDPLKPYVTLILDTSGSMDDATGAGPPSCGGLDNRLNHARCAINKIVNSYGDMVFALGRFRSTASGSFSSSCDANQNVAGGGNDDCGLTGVSCGACDCNGTSGTCSTTNCTADMQSDARSEMLTGLVDGNNDAAAVWTDMACGTCGGQGTALGSQPEIWGVNGYTPLGGALKGAQRYWMGLQATDSSVIWPSNLPGFAPIENDVLDGAFLPKPGKGPVCNPNPTTCNNAIGCTGANCCCLSQCRPYITILLTDGNETCGGHAPNAAAAMLTTDLTFTCPGGTCVAQRCAGGTRHNLACGLNRYQIQTKVIAFGITQPDTDIEAIAAAGNPLGSAPAGDEGYYAYDEASLQLSINSILAGAIRTETCNDLDDDCDILVDEDFAGKDGVCNNGLLGKCRVNGNNICRLDGTGLRCNAGLAACNGLAATNPCNVTNAANVSVPGTCQATPAGLACIPTPAASEVPFMCNNIDDDCDGKIDEGVTGCTCVPQTEICDGMNNDCDGATDEGTQVPCGTGTCLGVRPCLGAGGLGACTAQTPVDEVCNGLDDDCDGNRDGFNEACSNMTCPSGTCTGGTVTQRTCVGGTRAGKRCGTLAFPDPANNPGGDQNSACRALGAQCICNPGTRTCPLNGAGTWSSCTGEVEPRTEVCNDLDDDCDGLVDEAPPTVCTNDGDCPPITPSCDNPNNTPSGGTCQTADCSINSCGGRLICQNGVQTCTQTAGVDDTCNGLNEDCDQNVDEHWVCSDPDGPDDDITTTADNCACTVAGMCGAKQSCENGAVLCVGQPTAQESCDCDDDDCDGDVDEDTCGAVGGPGPAGSSCRACQCAFPCQGGEFPCPVGKTCINVGGGNFCLADPCFGVTCDPVNGNKHVCRPTPGNPADHECISACDPSQIQCSSPNICYGPTGECRPDDCTTFPHYCTSQQNCINGTCVTNPCMGVNCGEGQYCVGGVCYGSCAGVTCATGERCRFGTCQPDPCGERCPFGQVCHDDTGECVADPCSTIQCNVGQWCNPNNNGMCEDDPCIGTSCPNAGEICRGGTCFDPESFAPDAAIPQHVTTGGGGGCSTGGSGADMGLALGLAALLVRRRRTKGGAS